MVPVGVAQVGCVTEDTVGTAGGVGTALMVTVAAAGVMQELSVVFLTVKAYTPGVKLLKVALAWYPDPTEYCTPACVLKMMVPVGMAQVG